MSDWTEFQACFKKVSEICHDCLKTALRVFHVFFRTFHGNFKDFKTRGYQRSLQVFLWKCQGCFNSNSKALQVTFMRISKVYQRSSKDSKEFLRVFLKRFFCF